MINVIEIAKNGEKLQTPDTNCFILNFSTTEGPKEIFFTSSKELIETKYVTYLFPSSEMGPQKF